MRMEIRIKRVGSSQHVSVSAGRENGLPVAYHHELYPGVVDRKLLYELYDRRSFPGVAFHEFASCRSVIEKVFDYDSRSFVGTGPFA